MATKERITETVQVGIFFRADGIHTVYVVYPYTIVGLSTWLTHDLAQLAASELEAAVDASATSAKPRPSKICSSSRRNFHLLP